MIPTEEARKILGKKYNHLSDDKIKEITDWIYRFCNRILDSKINAI